MRVIVCACVIVCCVCLGCVDSNNDDEALRFLSCVCAVCVHVRVRVIVRYIQGSLRLPKPLSDHFPVRVCSCPLCM